ncbi:cobalt-precorrin-5B (C(1))-methyltransferase CbiD [Acetobacterium wieringae]|uniref:Cobalt-precorrin-5B C(1)-methyltransferase n=2 Tax=Acetobacterium wieringae TaxID=52694 RepID=A0ABY6HFL8_9FIRM|nr:cobalt-precorrin-5B (C(1))-methyltransferase CbiD [Acetobacterium wieringae]UYO63338.1 cobalt-precorrin-5B (C(1))-methyltransferase CbiD [Acetobacterium wieringae]VUZ24054.1 Cobalt-precorrin-5B C(1)-methyltransferase [Acetobacterium wieringae]
MFNKTVEKNGKIMRYGYTTGSCATAATKAALLMFLNQQKWDTVKINTPKGWPLDLVLHDQTFSEYEASCSVVKDAGDDPDVTNGIKIFAKVIPSDQAGITFIAGIGVGTVTSVGLSIPPGEPAINPTPREMIAQEIRAVLDSDAIKHRPDLPKGWQVELSIPQGVELAKRTFNPKLGIEGGLSIIGTTGIVEPMSEEAWKASLKLELSVLHAKGFNEIIFVPGNYGKDFSEELGLNETVLVKTSNFIGFMLDEAERMGFDKILLIGHLGKLVKVAGGIFNTHSSVADGRMEILTAHAGILGASREIMAKIMAAKTTDEATDIILAENLPDYFNQLAEVVKKKVTDRVYGTIDIEVVLFSKIHGFLGQSKDAEELRKRLCTH